MRRFPYGLYGKPNYAFLHNRYLIVSLFPDDNVVWIDVTFIKNVIRALEAPNFLIAYGIND